MKIIRILISLLFVSQLLAQPAVAQPTPAVVEKRNSFAQEHEGYIHFVSYIPAAISGLALFGLVAGHLAYRKSDRYNQFCGEIAERLVAGKDRREREIKEREEKEKKAAEDKREQDIKDAAAQRIRDRQEGQAREQKQKLDDAAAELRRLEKEREDLSKNVTAMTRATAHGKCPKCEDEDIDLFAVHENGWHQYCRGCLYDMNACPEPGCAHKFQRPANLERLWKDQSAYRDKITEQQRQLDDLRKNYPDSGKLPKVNTPGG